MLHREGPRRGLRVARPRLVGATVALVLALVAGGVPAAATEPRAAAVPRSVDVAPAAVRDAPTATSPPPDAAPLAAADAGDVGWAGPSFQGASGSPSGSKPESKLWHAHGHWWGVLFDSVSETHHIFRLDVAARRWVDTGTVVDSRGSARADVLFDGSRAYVATHVFRDNGSQSGQPSHLRRYRYDASGPSWVLEPGFPATINGVSSETLVIDKDGQGRLWATWAQGGDVLVTHTTGSDTAWAAPFVVPGSGHVSSDDISSVVAYAPGRIGVMWSSQPDEQMLFASRADSDPPGTWGAVEVAFEGTDAADDHINLTAVHDQGGRILVAAKTSRSGSAVLNHVLDRSPSGTWTSRPFGTGSNAHTRPIAVLDSSRSRLHVFATAGQSGGSIYTKSAPLSNLTFPSGRGTAVLTDADSSDINNATSTKQAVTSSTGLVVVATNDDTRQYWTHYDALGGTEPPPPPPPPTPPGAPTAVTATPARGEVTVRWGAAPSETPITGYRVTLLPAGTTRQVGPTVRQLVLDGLDVRVPVRAEVVAVNAAGAGPPATTATVLPGGVLPFASPTAFADQQSDDFHGVPASASLVAAVQARFLAGATAPEVIASDLFLDGPAWNGHDRGQGAGVTRLYLAFFRRPPESAGFEFWRRELTRGNSLGRIAGQFVHSPEFRTTYGGLSDDEFIDLVYRNVLGRGPDPGGFAYWRGRLRAGLSQGRLMVHFSESAENRAAQRPAVVVVLLWRAMHGVTPTIAVLDDEARPGRPATDVAEAILRGDRYQGRISPG